MTISPAPDLKPQETSLGRILSDLAKKSLEPGSLLSPADFESLSQEHVNKRRAKAMDQIRDLAQQMDAEVLKIRVLRQKFNADRRIHLKKLEALEKAVNRVAAGKDPADAAED